MPAWLVIVVQHTQPESSCEEMSTNKCVSVTPKLKLKPIYRAPLWYSNAKQLAPPAPSEHRVRSWKGFSFLKLLLKLF